MNKSKEKPSYVELVEALMKMCICFRALSTKHGDTIHKQDNTHYSRTMEVLDTLLGEGK